MLKQFGQQEFDRLNSWFELRCGPNYMQDAFRLPTASAKLDAGTVAYIVNPGIEQYDYLRVECIEDHMLRTKYLEDIKQYLDAFSAQQ